MSYAGNAKLSQEIQNRILTTFQQTLALVEEGNVQEALLGCDFVLRLDPLFEPARRLQSRLQESGSDMTAEELAAFAGSPLDVELPPLGEAEDSGIEAAAGEIDIELEESGLPEVDFEISIPHGDDLTTTLSELLAQREFARLLELAAQNQERVATEPDLRDITELAQVRLEAEPYVRSFLDSSRLAHQQGDLDKAQSLLAKARELDASHPQIQMLEAELMPVGSTPLESEASVPEGVDTNDEAQWLQEVTPEPFSASADLEPPASVLDSEPAARLDTDSERRIDDLLKEGQVAFERGEYQSAIDAWSRIFLIDIDHSEASRRIELARKLKAEVERQIEESFHDGISQFEAGDTEAARSAFDKVLEIQPGHIGAREYLDKLDGGESHIPEESMVTPIPTLEELSTTGGFAEDVELPTAGPMDLAPMPEPARASRRRTEDAARPARAARSKRTFVSIGAVVLVAVLAIGWFLYSRREQVFPNSDDQQSAAAVERTDPLTKATQLHEAGNTALAIAQLRRLAPDHPQYAQAQTLLAQWEERTAEAEEAEAAEPTEEDLAHRDELVAAARVALDNGENLVAADLLSSAAAIAPLGPEDLAFKEQAAAQLAFLEDQLKLFHQGDWEYALPNLWRLRDERPGNKDIERLMVGCYFNLGLRDLQRGDPVTAAEKFEEALSLDPDDLEVQRLAAFASAYKQRPSDLLYRVFVKYHPFR